MSKKNKKGFQTTVALNPPGEQPYILYICRIVNSPSSGNSRATHDLTEMLDQYWQSFLTGSRQSGNAFGVPIISTTGIDGPGLRTVVLRHCPQLAN